MNRPEEANSYNSRLVQDLRRLIARGEGQHLEFKRKATYPEKIVREMVAFANSEGGTLLVGVGDDGSLGGLKYPEGESHVIQKALLKCKPPLPVSEEFIPIGNGKTVIRYEVANSRKKPHAQSNGSQKDFFVRVNDQSIRASREVREIVERSRKKKDIRFYYGEHERQLVRYLDKHRLITLEKFMEVTGLKRYAASKKLVLLVLADVLEITPHEKGDVYSLAFGKE